MAKTPEETALAGKEKVLEKCFHDVGLKVLLDDQHEFVTGNADTTTTAVVQKEPLDLLELCQRVVAQPELDLPAVEANEASVSKVGMFGSQAKKPQQPEQKQDNEPPAPKKPSA